MARQNRGTGGKKHKKVGIRRYHVGLKACTKTRRRSLALEKPRGEVECRKREEMPSGEESRVSSYRPLVGFVYDVREGGGEREKSPYEFKLG